MAALQYMRSVQVLLRDHIYRRLCVDRSLKTRFANGCSTQQTKKTRAALRHHPHLLVLSLPSLGEASSMTKSPKTAM
jgi:hypothetical protein